MIAVIPLGCVDGEVPAHIAAALPKYIPGPVSVAAPLPFPGVLTPDARGRYRSTPLLEYLQGHRPRADSRILGIVDRDLFAPGLNFVFGEASLFGRAAVIALPRLRPEFYGIPEDHPLFLLRALKESVHELGHTYQLDHCTDHRCIMHFSNSIADTDMKGPGFCARCGASLRRRAAVR
ncbi:MAG: archaemetzincin family Zn-dependent metalloprotease [Spirochaetes bacterium]|nr:archaemetzincin family Zn-dependent metalloprotease [Spirochaetota bacterium]